MNPTTARRPTRLAHWGAVALARMIGVQPPVRMDGECLLAAGGEPLHGPFCRDVPEAFHFGVSHIEPIEDEA